MSSHPPLIRHLSLATVVTDAFVYFGKNKHYFFLIWVYFEPLACKEGYFGTNCSRECSSNCQPDTCRHTDGSCSCAPGWTGDNCTTGKFL